MMATPLEVDAGGNIVLGEEPGLGYALDQEILKSTRFG